MRTFYYGNKYKNKGGVIVIIMIILIFFSTAHDFHYSQLCLYANTCTTYRYIILVILPAHGYINYTGPATTPPHSIVIVTTTESRKVRRGRRQTFCVGTTHYGVSKSISLPPRSGTPVRRSRPVRYQVRLFGFRNYFFIEL